VLAWPGAVHEGNGRGHAFVDCETDEQFEILRRLWRGEEGGDAFEIYNSTLAEPTGVERARVELTLDGPRSHIVVGDAVRATMAPLLDPVSGEENVVRIVKPAGFDYQDGQVARTERMNVDASGIAFAYEDAHAAFFRFAYVSA
jgi:hypothetical protein